MVNRVRQGDDEGGRTRATVNKAYQRMKEETITGSKQLGVFGASYLLPVLQTVLSDS